MITAIGFIRRTEGLTASEFSEYWRDRHAPLVRSVPEFMRHVQRYVQYHRHVPEAKNAERFDYDGVGLLNFEDIDTLRLAYGDPRYRNDIRPDERNFFDTRDMLAYYATEHVIHERPSTGANGPGVTVIGLPRRAVGLTRDEFSDYWLNRHAPLVRRAPDFLRHVRKYTQYHLAPVQYGAEPAESFHDGVGMVTFDSFEDVRAAFSEPQYLEILRPDEERFFDTAALTMLFAKEHVIYRVGE
jgi:uncharacterized protein (TIGR02118 family)